ncbi:hypothetical protein FGIG_00491 [Fasciola gigantica]|uniref:Uncharacterized protein n=1 Tax=Fasciola gigantica TaxID=46835 RepID=A0A504YZY2_FASGI|nr:hypothetical protein FGIG_00491 [Fasciola gigantica]
MRDLIQPIFGLVTRGCPSRDDSMLATFLDISFTFRRMSFVDDSLNTPASKFDKERKNASINQCALHFALLVDQVVYACHGVVVLLDHAGPVRYLVVSGHHLGLEALDDLRDHFLGEQACRGVLSTIERVCIVDKVHHK